MTYRNEYDELWAGRAIIAAGYCGGELVKAGRWGYVAPGLANLAYAGGQFHGPNPNYTFSQAAIDILIEDGKAEYADIEGRVVRLTKKEMQNAEAWEPVRGE